jgi:hypothetical protein
MRQRYCTPPITATWGFPDSASIIPTPSRRPAQGQRQILPATAERTASSACQHHRREDDAERGPRLAPGASAVAKAASKWSQRSDFDRGEIGARLIRLPRNDKLLET